MRHFNNNGKSVWGQPRPDSFPTNRFGGRVPTGGRRDGGGYHRSSGDDGDFDGRPLDDHNHDDHVNPKLDRLLERIDKFDIWRDETDRKFENLDPILEQETEQPSGFAEDEDPEWDDHRQKTVGERVSYLQP